MQDDLTLVAGGRALSGWTSTRVTRGVERVPSDFDIEMTSRYPGEVDSIVVQPGDAARVYLGTDLVLTGYVDRYTPEINRNQHSIRVTGRSKCEDIVDCSAEWPGGQISGTDALDIAQKLASPYGISVSSIGPQGPRIPQFNLILGETAYEIIERVCRYSALLAYDQPDGNLLLAQAGTEQAASGIDEGVNVQRASLAYSMDERYSEYYVYLQSMDTLNDLGDGGNLAAHVNDDTVPRHRRLDIISEQGGGGLAVAIKRANWERSRRYGRSQALRVEVDSWRDAAGTLWTPNTLIPVELPHMKATGKVWAIGEVTYHLDEQGTWAELVIMPKEAFLPEPVLLLPFYLDVPPGMGSVAP